MRIAIVGSGISGLTAAYQLQSNHEVTLLEANDYVGGHTNTIDVEFNGRVIPVDTGFIVFNDATYPNFIRLLNEWQVDSQPTKMSFSVRCDRSGWEYSGGDLNGLFAQRSNLFNWRFYRLLGDFLRFGKLAKKLVAANESTQTVSEFISEQRLSPEFRDKYFLPMGAAIWSCPTETFGEFPIRFIAEFYANHGLLDVFNRPQWRVIKGGSQTYVRKILQSFRGTVRTNAAVSEVHRSNDDVRLLIQGSGWETFDHVIFACHSDQALKILGQEATPTERELLSGFPYEANTAVLHTDISLLPRLKRAWACWNYLVPAGDIPKATVTYNMNMLQTLHVDETYLVTLNGEEWIDPRKIIRRFVYHHPIFTTQRAALQKRHHELIGRNRTSFCGAYWRNGFHEDGVVSALAVCEALEHNHPHAQLPLRGNRVSPATFAG